MLKKINIILLLICTFKFFTGCFGSNTVYFCPGETRERLESEGLDPYDENLFVCDQCREEFHSVERAFQHSQEPHDGEYDVSHEEDCICLFDRNTEKADLVDAMRNFGNGFYFRCTECNESFNDIADALSHQNAFHEGDSPCDLSESDGE